MSVQISARELRVRRTGIHHQVKRYTGVLESVGQLDAIGHVNTVIGSSVYEQLCSTEPVVLVQSEIRLLESSVCNEEDFDRFFSTHHILFR